MTTTVSFCFERCRRLLGVLGRRGRRRRGGSRWCLCLCEVCSRETESEGGGDRAPVHPHQPIIACGTAAIDRRGGDLIDAAHAHALVARPLAGQDRHVATSHAERRGEDGDELGIGRAVHRRRAETDQHRVVAGPREPGPAGPRNHADRQHDAVGGHLDHRVQRNASCLMPDASCHRGPVRMPELLTS